MQSFEYLEQQQTVAQKQSVMLMHWSTPLLFIAMALYCVIGFTGFDPVRQDEAYIFDIILEYSRGHTWVVPLLAGHPHVEKPPLYYLLASFSMRAFTPWLSPHDAARLGSGFFIAASTLCIAYASRLTWGAGYGRFAALALLCSVGLFVPAHMMLTDNAQMTGCALALLGLAAHVRSRWWSGLALGSGAGFAFLSKGLLGPGVIGLTALLLLLWPRWRTHGYFATLVIAFIAILPWLVIWPVELYQSSPVLFYEWLSQNNLARFAGTAPDYLNAVKEKNFWYTKFLWSTFPTLPLALCNIRRYRATAAEQPALHIGFAFAVVMILVLATSATLRAIYAMPLLLAFALIAAPALHAPPRWFRMSAHAVRYLFVFGALLIWSYWLIVAVLKVNLLPYLAIAAPTPHRHLHILSSILAIAVTALWFVCQRAWGEERWRRSADWYSSIFSLLALFSLLCLPALSAKDSYRQLFQQLGNYLPAQGCVNSIGLGESQQGMLDYVLNIQTSMISDMHDAQCDAVLIDTSAHSPLPSFSDAWQLRWRGKRDDRGNEIFYFYTRTRAAQ